MQGIDIISITASKPMAGIAQQEGILFDGQNDFSLGMWQICRFCNPLRDTAEGKAHILYF